MDYHVPSVEVAARILKLLSRYKYRLCTLTDIAQHLDVSKTTCLRILRTLEREDFVRYDEESKKYSLGPYLVPLGNRAAEFIGPVSSAMAELPHVARKTRFTSVLVERMKNHRLIYLASAEPPDGSLHITVSVGQQFPDFGAAFGRCFLAYEDESEWQRMLETGLPQYTLQTPVRPEDFLKKLRETKSNGYAVSHGELTPGFSAAAAPIFNKHGQVELVLACLAVTSQFDKETLERTVTVLLEASRRLSEWYGFHAAHP